MPDNTSTQSPAATAPAAGATAAPPAPPPERQPSFQAPATATRSEEAWLAQEQRLRDAQAAAQTAADLKAKLDKIEADRLAEQGKYKELYEKEQESRKQTESKMRARLARSELRAYAIAEGIIDPDLVALIPNKDMKINDESGEFENVRELIAQQKKDKPHLYKGTAASTTAAVPTTGDPARAPTSDAAPKPKDVSKMSREEYAEWKNSLRRGLRSVNKRG